MQKIQKVYDSKNPTTLIQFDKIRRGALHPTQKPVPLLEYLIKTYTNEGDTVLDFTCGSGSTLVACRNTGRRFIGIEYNPERDKNGELVEPDKYYKVAVQRLDNM